MFNNAMRIIPVLDLKAGQVVRGIAGRRDEYRPIVSRLTSSSEPLDVAQAVRHHFGLTELYLADLDAIAGAPPSLAIYAALRALGFRLWVDAGVRNSTALAPLIKAGIETIVVGLETIAGPNELAELRRDLGNEQLVFSLDMKRGVPLGNRSAWAEKNAWSIAAQAIAIGVRRLVVLDLARVGMNAGTGTEELCRRLTSKYPEVAVVAGGGIRNISDLRRLKQCGAAGALVASALHDGRMRPEDLAEL